MHAYGKHAFTQGTHAAGYFAPKHRQSSPPAERAAPRERSRTYCIMTGAVPSQGPGAGPRHPAPSVAHGTATNRLQEVERQRRVHGRPSDGSRLPSQRSSRVTVSTDPAQSPPRRSTGRDRDQEHRSGPRLPRSYRISSAVAPCRRTNTMVPVARTSRTPCDGLCSCTCRP